MGSVMTRILMAMMVLVPLYFLEKFMEKYGK